MWIKEPQESYRSQTSFIDNVLFLWRCDTQPIYVMDNHLAAAWCWLQECNSEELYNFMHIDRHSDLRGCGYLKDIECLKRNPRISFEEYTKITYDNCGENTFFQWDNYIRACQYLFPQWFNTNLFYTFDDDECSPNNWGYDEFLTQSRDPLLLREDITHYINKSGSVTWDNTVADKMKGKKWIVNLDLDFFWDFDGVKIFDDEFISDLGKCINQSMKNIEVLTIAMSPECIGGRNLQNKWQNAIGVINILKNEIGGLQKIPCDFFSYLMTDF